MSKLNVNEMDIEQLKYVANGLIKFIEHKGIINELDDYLTESEMKLKNSKQYDLLTDEQHFHNAILKRIEAIEANKRRKEAGHLF